MSGGQQGTGIKVESDTIAIGLGGDDADTVVGINGYWVGARVSSADLTSTWDFAARYSQAPGANVFADTTGSTVDRSYDRTDFRIPVTAADTVQWAVTNATNGQAGAIKLYFEQGGSLGQGIKRVTTAISAAAPTGTISLATNKINGSLVGYYVDSTVSLGTTYTLTVYDGTDTTGPVLISDTSGTLERAADRTTIDIPVHQSDSLHFVFGSIDGGGTGTLALFFDLGG